MKVDFYKTDFIGAVSKYEESEIVLFGVPFDGTCSYRPGSRFAPNSIRLASSGLELYSVYQDANLKDSKFYDAGNVSLPFNDITVIFNNIATAVKGFLDDGKKVLTLGGEHLITSPIVKEYLKKYPELAILHFDAHTDLREEFYGERLSHATVIKRIYDMYCGDYCEEGTKPAKESIFQFGIRSGLKEEFDFAKKYINICKHDASELKDAVSTIKGRPVYLTFDVDIFDPSVLPGTGTPEPGGISFKEFITILGELRGMNIVGIDVVELAPDYDTSMVSSVVTAKVVREFLMLMKKK